MLAFRLLCQFVNRLEVEYLPACHPSEAEKCDASTFARRVQLQVAQAMGVPTTEHAVEDIQFEFAAVKARLPAEVGVVGFSALKEVFSVNAQQIKQQMLVFKEMDRDRSGRVNFDEFKECFQRAFHAPSAAQTELLRQFFHELTGGQPTLDFRRFLIGLALVNESKGSSAMATSPPKFEDFVDKYRMRMYVHLAFAAFAASSDDRIAWLEFEELWSWLHPAGILAAGVSNDNPRAHRKLERRPSAAEEIASSAREVFEEIGGSGVKELSFEQFSSYAERNPHFEKRLRHAFFSRVSSELAPH